MSTLQQQQQQQQLEQTRKQANLRLLQRTCNANITDILQTATHVVLYEFLNQAWVKCPVEGSLFLTVASTSTSSQQQQQQHLLHELIILNRNSADNFQMKISWDLQMQDQDPYLIFKQPTSSLSAQNADTTKIQGIWFHNAQERLAVARIIENVLHSLRNPTPVAAPAATPPSGYPMEPSSSLFASSSVDGDGQAAAAATATASQDEREHLAALLSQTAVTVTTAATTAAAATASARAPSVGGGKQQPPGAAAVVTSSRSSSTGSHNSASAGAAGIALDKKSLQLALLSLIQDDRFLDLLHSQYLRVVHARSKKQQQGSSSVQQDDDDNDGHHKDDL
jgi:mRNA-decapping enzyme 1B